MTIYSLYVKTHTITGLKYLGYTSEDPFKYKGSGHYWKRHISKHGYYIETNIIFQTTDLVEIKSMGQHYSKLWNIVEAIDNNGNKLWANLKEESGQGGAMSPLSITKMKSHHPPSQVKVTCVSCRKTIGYPNFIRSHGAKCGIKQLVCVGKSNPRFDKTPHTFYNWNTGEKFQGTRYDFYHKYSMNKAAVCSLIKGSIIHIDGWSLHKVRPTPKTYKWIHKSGKVKVCTDVEFMQFHNVRWASLVELIKLKDCLDRQTPLRGWRLLDL
jgi:hypothetical protein